MSTGNQVRLGQQPNGTPLYQFGPFVLDTFQHALLREGKPVALTPKTYDTLLVLVKNRGRMLSKDELMNTLWPDSFVEEANLTQQVSMIRKALGDSSGDPRYIHTVPGRGYRFTPEVQDSTEQKTDLRPSTAPQVQSETRSENISPLRDEQGHGTLAPLPPVAVTSAKAAQNYVFRLALAAGLALSLLLVARSFYRQPTPTALTQVALRTLAILPLHNLRPTPDDDFLGFSLADAVITKLDYVSSLSVRPSSAVEKYRNQVIDIQNVGADLNVDTLLTGSYIRDHDNLRITYQLIDVKTEKLLGKGEIDLKYDDLLRVQDNVAQKIVQELQVNLSPLEAERLQANAPVSPLAYEYYLRGVDLHSQHKFPLAIKMLEKSTQIDPNYAPAWAYLGASYTSDAAFELGGRDQYRRAQSAYEHSLALQPSQLDAQVFLANSFIDTGKVEQAVPLLRNALKANANYAPAHWELGYAYRFAGMLNESVAECERARLIDPFVKGNNGSVLNAYLYLGEYDKFLSSLPEVDDSAFFLFYRGFGEYHQKNWELAARDFDRAFDLAPDLYSQIGKAFSDSIRHREPDGLAILRSLEKKIDERGVGDPEATYKIAQAYATLGDKVSALRALRDSVDGGFFAYSYIAADPLLNPVRNDPKFNAILNTSFRRYQAFRSKFF
jgi:DNA-binding winged helix-turn-helix (wHTH) protein/TolB-like protein/Tfp pilus assembly protein PilF